MNQIELPNALVDPCFSCDHKRITHYDGPTHNCNISGCKCDAFKNEDGQLGWNKVIYLFPLTNSIEHHVNVLKSLTKEYPNDKTLKGDRFGGYHFVVGDVIAIEAEFGERLMNEIASTKPLEVVEIGTGKGYSTAWLMLGLLKAGRGKLTTFDKEFRNLHVNKTPVPGEFTMYIKDSKDIKNDLPGHIDFLFHDASHTFEGIVYDLEIVLPRSRKIWFHDAYDEVSIPLKDYFKGKGWSYTWEKDSSHFGFAEKIT